MNNYLIPVTHFEDEIMESSKGSYITDTNGKSYIDLNSGQFCTVLGHSNPYVLNSIYESSKKIVHTASNILSKEVIKASENLHRISGKLHGYSITLSTGAEAVEFAIRYAKHITGKSGIACFDKGYHGLTLGTQSVTYSGLYANPPVSNIYPISIPDTFCTESELDKHICQLANLLEIHSSDIAAILMEPIASVGGMILPPAKWFQETRNLCNKYDILLIYDESQTGFGRTGNWFAYETYNAIPHIVTLAKGVGLGYPVSVVMFNEELIPDSTFSMTHYSSHQNDSFSANIINTGINYIEENNILQQIKLKGDYFKNKLLELENESDYVKGARGCGLMLGVDLNIPDITNYRPIYANLYRMMMSNGVLIQGTNGGRTLRFLPDYLISEDDISIAVDTLKKILKNKKLF